jgi:hypothetical protein
MKQEKPKRKTWHDRRCGHGNKPVTRIQYDMIHCDEPECRRQVLRSLGFVSVKDMRALIEAVGVEALRDAPIAGPAITGWAIRELQTRLERLGCR